MKYMAAPITPLPAPQTAVSGRKTRWVPWAAAVLLALHFALAVGSKLHESTTSDELFHLTGGMSYWLNHDYRLQPENGILPQRWAALPAWLAHAKFPPLANNVYWSTSDQWVIGHQFFYETGEDHFPRLMAGRAMIAMFSVALGLLVFVWSRRLFGNAGAFVSLGFFVFSPDFLAHGAIVTSDVCMAFFFLAAAGAWWRHLHDGRTSAWWLSAVTLGLAFVTKYSAVLLVPMMVFMAAVRALAPAPLELGGRAFTTRAGKFGAAALSAAGHALVVASIIWLFYGFRYAAFNPALPPADHFIRPWAEIDRHIGLAAPVIRGIAAAHLLPEAFLYGLAYVIETAGSRSAFLNGAYSVTGWPMFFPWTFFLKTTLSLLFAGVLVVGLAGQRLLAKAGRWRAVYRATPLIMLFTVYWISSLTSHLNIGHRHILPTYPVLFIATGALGAWFGSRSFVRVAAVALLLTLQVVEALRIAPHFLAYFNAFAGGPENGWRHLVDSSLDWGQDLPGLKTWLDQHATGEEVYLSYFGTGEPAYYGIRTHRLAEANNFMFPVSYVALHGGVYCISATMLQQVYTPVQGPWTLDREKEYQELRALEPIFAEYQRDPARRAELEREAPANQWQRAIRRHDWLRLARLCAYLRLRPADAHIGYSILIFRLNAGEVAGATAGSLADWRALIERAAAAKL